MNQEPNLFGLEVDSEASQHFMDAGTWARRLAIIGIALLVIVLIFLVVNFGALISVIGMNLESTDESPTILMGVILLVFFGLFGVICYFLYTGGARVKESIQNSDQSGFERGLLAFRNFFIISGILSLLMLISDLLEFF